jgi:hypothetical protein
VFGQSDLALLAVLSNRFQSSCAAGGGAPAATWRGEKRSYSRAAMADPALQMMKDKATAAPPFSTDSRSPSFCGLVVAVLGSARIFDASEKSANVQQQPDPRRSPVVRTTRRRSAPRSSRNTVNF